MTSRRGGAHLQQTQAPPASPLEAFRRDDVLERLAADPGSRQYIVDSGFRESLEKLRVGSHEGGLRLIQHDPRLMQAMTALNGYAMDVTEADVRAAERVGDIKRRDAVQTADVEVALQCATVADAKEAGNSRFKAGEYSTALACYLRASEMLVANLTSEIDSANNAEATGGTEGNVLQATLRSNSAAALLKLERFDEALQACDEALSLSAAPSVAAHAAGCAGVSCGAGAGVSKMHYRRGHALEGLKRWDEAIAAMGHAHDEASGAASARPILQEIKRLERLRRAAEEKAEVRRAQAMRETAAEQKRSSGVTLPTTPPATPTGNVETITTAGGVVAGYLAEQDFSHWARRELSSRLHGLRHARAGATIVVERLDEARSEVHVPSSRRTSPPQLLVGCHPLTTLLVSQVHASVQEKRGKRALYYDLDLLCHWVGHCAIGREESEPAEMRGEFRLYNVGQDTQFRVDGDLQTSYLYTLGFPSQYSDDERYALRVPFERILWPPSSLPHVYRCDLWARHLKYEASELFDLVSNLVSVWVKDFVKKASA